jgi:hypothetical protein
VQEKFKSARVFMNKKSRPGSSKIFPDFLDKFEKRVEESVVTFTA